MNMQVLDRPADAKAKTNKIVMDELLAEVLKHWGEFSTRYDGKPAEGASAGMAQEAIGIQGAAQGVMLLSAPAAFGRLLLLGSDVPGHRSEDAFRTFALQVSLQFCRFLSEQGAPAMAGTQTLQSGSAAWPQGRPRLSLALIVDGVPLELRLWLKCPEEAMIHLDASRRRPSQRKRIQG